MFLYVNIYKYHVYIISNAEENKNGCKSVSQGDTHKFKFNKAVNTNKYRDKIAIKKYKLTIIFQEL